MLNIYYIFYLWKGTGFQASTRKIQCSN